MDWHHHATSHYLSQCWPKSMRPYGITKTQWVKSDMTKDGKHKGIFVSTKNFNKKFQRDEILLLHGHSFSRRFIPIFSQITFDILPVWDALYKDKTDSHDLPFQNQWCLGFFIIQITYCTGIILCMCPDERWCYIVTSSLIGCTHTQNDHWLYPAHVK